MELYAKDLRIGNWVYNPIQKINILVDFNVLNLIRLDNLRYAREIKKGEECFQPIPLTEDICRKFLDNDEEWSFEGYGTRLIYRHKKFGSIKVEIGGYDQISLYVNNELLGFKSHLHKIQNIFYALTQTELKIEL